MLNRKNTKCPNCNLEKHVTKKHSKVNGFDIYFCANCKNGFTAPVPKNLSSYYHKSYWISAGILGSVKKWVFDLFQKRRKIWLLRYLVQGRVLEIGAGEGDFARYAGENFEFTQIEFPKAAIENPDILKVDFLSWRSPFKFDAVVFWESLEHVPAPQRYLEHAYKCLKDGGLLFVEAPRFDCFESALFSKYWFHLDLPRHLSHMSARGLSILLSRAGFKILAKKSVLAYEYVIWGLAASVLNLFGASATDYLKRSKLPILLVLLLPLAVFATLMETIFFIFDQSPIVFMVARKKNV